MKYFIEQKEQRDIPGPIQQEDRPIFVRIQQYREAMASIEILRERIKEVEYLLDKIDEIRAQEQVELKTCYANLNKIKEKLIEIDKKLFEV